jgi:phage antirepressor YoqD-like protein
MRIMTAHKKDYISMPEKKIVKFMVENNLRIVESNNIKCEHVVYLRMDLIRVKITSNGQERKIDVKIVNKK